MSDCTCLYGRVVELTTPEACPDHGHLIAQLEQECSCPKNGLSGYCRMHGLVEPTYGPALDC